MQFHLVLLSLAYSGIVQDVRLLAPLMVLAIVCLILEGILVWRDIAFSRCWWFFFSTVLLVVGALIWSSWTVSTPMADIINYGENAGGLIVAIATYLIILGILLLWTLVAGVRQVVIEAGGSGWGWALVRLAPAAVLLALAIGVLGRGDAAVGGDGLLRLMGL